MLNEMEIKELAAVFLRRAEDLNDEESYDSIWDLDELISTNPALGWRVVEELFAQASTRRAIHMVAAGPLEDLIRKHGNSLEFELTELYAKSKRFQYALTSIYLPPGTQFEWLRRLVDKACLISFTATCLGISE